jgi:hypothetical protein
MLSGMLDRLRDPGLASGVSLSDSTVAALAGLASSAQSKPPYHQNLIRTCRSQQGGFNCFLLDFQPDFISRRINTNLVDELANFRLCRFSSINVSALAKSPSAPLRL